MYNTVTTIDKVLHNQEFIKKGINSQLRNILESTNFNQRITNFFTIKFKEPRKYKVNSKSHKTTARPTDCFHWYRGKSTYTMHITFENE